MVHRPQPSQQPASVTRGSLEGFVCLVLIGLVLENAFQEVPRGPILVVLQQYRMRFGCL